MYEHEEHPLVKEVPGHLFQFEEKIFGMSLTQLLSDIGAGVGIVSITASLQHESIAYQERHLHHCTITRHFVVVSASAREEAARQAIGSAPGGALTFLWKLLSRPKRVEVSREQVLDQLRIRISVVTKILLQLEVRAWLLDDADLLKQFASCLARGAKIPSFEPE